VFGRSHVSDDVFGNAYKHLIRNFVSRAGKSSGEFMLPLKWLYLMSEIVEPQPGNSLAELFIGFKSSAQPSRVFD
jgi:type I restriction enzyme M protein